MFNKCRAVSEMDDRLATTDMGRKLGAVRLFMGRASWIAILHSVASAEAYLRTKWHLDSPSRLAEIDMVEKWELGPHLTQSRLGRVLPPCQVAS